MADAAERLARLLHVFPAASTEGGVALEELARELEVPRSVVLDDLTEVRGRSYYHPAGSGDDIQIHIRADRVSVWTTGAFQRPVKLAPLEVFCLALGLRRQAMDGGRGPAKGAPGRGADPNAADPHGADTHSADAHDDDAPGGDTHGADTHGADTRSNLLRRVEAHLASGPVPDEAAAGLHALELGPDPEGVRDLLADAVRLRLRCRIRYLKPGEPAPEARRIHPHAVAHAEGRWYVVAWCLDSDGARAFRLDRILDAELTGEPFDPAADDVDVEAFLQGGRVYHAHHESEVVVRYSPTVRRWVEEWASEPRPQDDGSVLVHHRIADPEWIVRHVLAYAGEAEVLEPEGVRRMLRELGGP